LSARRQGGNCGSTHQHRPPQETLEAALVTLVADEYRTAMSGLWRATLPSC
jgi:hypothetical protein